VLKSLALVAAFIVLPFPSGKPLPRARPALVRLRVVVTTASPKAEVTLDPGTIVNASVSSDSGSALVRAEGNRLSFTHPAGGVTEMQSRVLVSGMTAAGSVRWRVKLTPPASAKIEIDNENEQGRPRIVDRFDADTGESTFESPAALLSAGGPVRIEAGPRPLVLAFFYPWYLYSTWSSGRLRDRPLSLYSTENPDEVRQSLGDVQAAGLDGVVVSWVGNVSWSDRRLRIVLDQAQTLGLTVSILVETLLATDVRPDGSVGPVPDKMRRWLEKAFDQYAQHAAFLRVRSRPVVFVYAADTFTADEWRSIVSALEQSGRGMLLMTDSPDPALLNSFHGAFRYTTATMPQSDLEGIYADQALRTQSYNLSHGGARRVYAAPVSPGYDDSRLGRNTSSVIDRANGAFYDTQWKAAVAAAPDWVLITSWNEFFENTHVEPSVRYQRQYQVRTRTWSDLFRSTSAADAGR
jgi:hypothetical protein